MNIIWRGSPNKDGSSYRKNIDRVVLHWFGIGSLTSADNRFRSSTGGASAHYGVSDGTVYQWVKESEVAWHAGYYPMNQRSIGIEHDATTIKNATEKTYETAGKLLADVCTRHNIPLDREHIIKHSQVSPTQCPGTLDVDKIIALAKGGIMSLTQDIGTAEEEKYNLKEVPRYNKYWTYEELINDWVKMYEELKYNTEEKIKYKEEARKLRDELKGIVEDIVAINKELESVDGILADQKAKMLLLEEEVEKTSTNNTALLEENKGLKAGISSLTERNEELEGALKNNLNSYPIKDMLAAIFDRIFKGGV